MEKQGVSSYDFIPVESDNETKEELGQTVMNNYLKRGDILHIEAVDINQEFEGIVFCVKSKIRPNVYEPERKDGYFQLVDGSGIQFPAAFYSMDSWMEEYKGPMLVKGIKYIGQSIGGMDVIRYRLTFISQTKADYPKSIFLKYIDNFDTLLNNYQNKVAEHLKSSTFKALYAELLKYGLLDNFKDETLAAYYGTKCGTKMEFMVTALDMIDAIPNIPDKPKLNKELVTLLIILKLWHPTVEVDTIEIPEQMAEGFLVNDILYRSSLDKLSKIKLTEGLKNSTSSIEASVADNIFKTLSDYYRLMYRQELLTNKTGLLG